MTSASLETWKNYLGLLKLDGKENITQRSGLISCVFAHSLAEKNTTPREQYRIFTTKPQTPEAHQRKITLMSPQHKTEEVVAHLSAFFFPLLE